MKLTKLLFILFLFLISSNLFAQGEYLDRNVKAFGFNLGYQGTSESSIHAFTAGIGSTSIETVDFGLNVGLLSSGAGKLLSVYVAGYPIKQLKNNETPVTMGIFFQPVFFDSDYSNTVEATIGTELSTRIKQANSSFAFQPNAGISYTLAGDEGIYNLSFGTSIYSLSKDNSIGVKIIGSHYKFKDRNLSGWTISVNLFYIFVKSETELFEEYDGDYNEKF